jgi:alkylation response protein AidB-like acyl-CoA dehydrogenase
LACERGPIFWQRAGWLLHHLGEIAGIADADDVAAQRAIGQAFADVSALRARSLATQQRVASGDLQAADSSIDKILIAVADQSVFDVARLVLPGVVEFDDSPLADRYRKEWAYSRAATIYGGTSEIQREIVASRLLDLPKVP